MTEALAPAPFVDSDHPSVIAFANEHAAGAQSDVETAVKLYYAVRDGIRYDPYSLAMTVEGRS